MIGAIHYEVSATKVGRLELPPYEVEELRNGGVFQRLVRKGMSAEGDCQKNLGMRWGAMRCVG
jgi:hypothetical protein